MSSVATVLLGGFARLGPVAIGDVNGIHGFVSLGIDPSWEIPTAALVTSVSWAPEALAVLANGCFEVVGVGRSARPWTFVIRSILQKARPASKCAGSRPARLACADS